MIVNHLRALIDAKHINISSLSRQIGLSRNTIYNLINNEHLHGYQIETLNKICGYFHVNISDVLTFIEDKLSVKVNPNQIRITGAVGNKVFYVTTDCQIYKHAEELGTAKLMTKIDITYRHVIRLIYQINGNDDLNKGYLKSVFDNAQNMEQPITTILQLPHIHKLIRDNYVGELLPLTGYGDNDQQSFDFNWDNKRKIMTNFKPINLKGGYLNIHDRFIFQ